MRPWFSLPAAGLAMAELQNKAGKFIAPSATSGQATLTATQSDMPANLRRFFPDPPGEDSYPIVTYSWILLYGHYPDQKCLCRITGSRWRSSSFRRRT